MYRHLAEFIKETPEKRFISQTDKEKYDGYTERFIESKDVYNKEEFDNIMHNIKSSLLPFKGENISVDNTKVSQIEDIEIYGNTIQNSENIHDIRSVGLPLGDGTYKLSLKSTGKNIFDGNLELDGQFFQYSNGNMSTNPEFNSYILPVHPNTRYEISQETDKEISNITYWDINLQFIIGQAYSTNVLTPVNCKFMRVAIHKDARNVQIEKSVKSEYGIYKDSKTNLVLPVQLEKVGNVSDRLFKRKDGIWCIEKYIKTIKLREHAIYEHNIIFKDGDLLCGTSYGYDIENLPEAMAEEGDCINTISQDKLSHLDWYNVNKAGTYIGKSAFAIVIRKNELSEPTVEAFKEYLLSCDHEIMYIRETPEIIELPLETQIYLNSFEGSTNIFVENTLVGPIISGKTAINIGGSVNLLHDTLDQLNKDIDRIEKLEESSTIKYESNNGCANIEESNNGAISDIKLEGETLVNHLPSTTYRVGISDVEKGKVTIVESINKCNITVNEHIEHWLYINAGETSRLKQNTYYTIYCGESLNVEYIVLANHSHTILASTPGTLVNNVAIIKTTDDYDNIVDAGGIFVYISLRQPTSNEKFTISDITILEGDHTDKDLSYFEGLKSVGDDIDKIGIIDRKENVNLLDTSKLTYGQYSYTDNSLIIDTNTNHIAYKEYIRVKPNTYYKTIRDFTVVTFLDKNYKYIGNFVKGDYESFMTPKHCYFIKIRSDKEYPNQLDNFKKKCFLVEDLSYRNNNYIYNRIQPLYLDPIDSIYKKPVLRGLPNGTKDTIEKHNDGKWYYHKRCEEIILNGGETSWVISEQNDNYIKVHLSDYPTNISYRNASNILCDRFVTVWDSPGFDNVKGEYISNTVDRYFSIVICLNKSKLSTPDIEGFKSWLQANPVTVVYQLLDEEVYECTPLSLNTYEGETSIFVLSGPISPKMSFTTNKFIGDVVSNLQERTNVLENSVINHMIFQNKLLLSSTYMGDKTSLKYSISTKSNYKVNSMVGDIANLLYSNIEAGKENYNRIEIEEIIDFYTMTGEISFDDAEILFNMISNQHVEIEGQL